VLASVGFDDDLAAQTDEVNDVWADRLLAPETHSEAIAAYQLPDRQLGRGQILAEADGSS
jgi:hypothetical protein